MFEHMVYVDETIINAVVIERPSIRRADHQQSPTGIDAQFPPSLRALGRKLQSSGMNLPPPISTRYCAEHGAKRHVLALNVQKQEWKGSSLIPVLKHPVDAKVALDRPA
jgi:hypothetical protein